MVTQEQEGKHSKQKDYYDLDPTNPVSRNALIGEETVFVRLQMVKDMSPAEAYTRAKQFGEWLLENGQERPDRTVWYPKI